MSAEATCAICSRTILAGERVHAYLDGAAERAVCELCVARAERLGWRPAAEARVDRRVSHGGRERLNGLLHRRQRRPEPGVPSPFERAVARFNSSEAGHAVAGLTRTLGSPWASVGAAAGFPDQVRITVAWELSWYQWAVDIADELRPVFELDKGGEIGELDPAARQWNAAVGEDGRLTLGAPAAAKR
jgi:hypothetical protein